MAAYSPVAVKVFGSQFVTTEFKVTFMRSLVESRLFFNAHILVMSLRALRAMNGSYMRVVRRIADDVRFGKCEGNDMQARLSIGVPSIDCI